MKKIYQLKKTSYWGWDNEKGVNYQINDDFSEEFYSSYIKAFKALVNHLRVEKGDVTNPCKDINLFPREHFVIEKHYKINGKPRTDFTKWELIEIIPW